MSKTRGNGPGYKRHIFICQGKTCSERLAASQSSAEDAKAFFKEQIKAQGLNADVRACTASCFNYCDDGPNIVEYSGTGLQTKWHSGVTRTDWQKIFEDCTRDLDK